jgi:hypothetical protein
MNKIVMLVALAVFGLGMITTAAAQSKPSKVSAVHTHSQVRHKTSKVAMPDDSKKLSSDLAKLEGQTSRTVKPARRTPEKKVVFPAKTVNHQDGRNNPPINFSYSGKGGSASHMSGASHATTAPAKAGPRMR